jgi:hypothetical protein
VPFKPARAGIIIRPAVELSLADFTLCACIDDTIEFSQRPPAVAFEHEEGGRKQTPAF